jgi:putative transposase
VDLARQLLAEERWPVSRVAKALGVSRPHLSATRSRDPVARGAYCKVEDGDLLQRIEAIVSARPSYGYRRVTALLNREQGQERVNHKRVYRAMRRANLLLARHAPKPERPHDGKVVTLKSDLRWCSDGFQIRCWNGERVHVVFSLDCCDREAIAWHASTADPCAIDIQDLMAVTIEARFGSSTVAHPVEWLSDNGPPYTAGETRRFGRNHGLLVRNTPSYSPESNGMAESFVKTFKRDYVYLADVSDAETVLAQIEDWFLDYNEHHPHKGLKMLSPRQFRRQVAT